MNAQFKKGVLQLVVLKTILEDDLYGYEMVTRINKVIDVNEGTIYPLLKRLLNDHLLESYLKESKEGPPRKYYETTELGEYTCRELKNHLKKLNLTLKALEKGSKK